MNRDRFWWLLLALVTGAACGAWILGEGAAPARAQHGQHQQEPGQRPGASMQHTHAPVPLEYRDVKVPAGLWTNRAMIDRGRSIYDAKCAVCHGADGSGNGPAAASLEPKPPSLRDRAMMAQMSPAYSFWRVSEGGAVEPFRSMRSAMPAWKDDLPVTDRWAVIAYQHTFSGHRGAHDPSQHPELRGGEASPRR
ncbi:MAG TPA: cytochrome c [Methylomirabilota bacterium]|nr:cytochrome c [Methylomirabilota bacterium]